MFPAPAGAISIDITLEAQRCHRRRHHRRLPPPRPSLPQDLLWVLFCVLRLLSYFLLTVPPRHCRHTCWRGSLIHGLKDRRCFIIYFPRGEARRGWIGNAVFTPSSTLANPPRSFSPFRFTFLFFSHFLLSFSLPFSRFRINIILRIRHRRGIFCESLCVREGGAALGTHLTGRANTAASGVLGSR